MNNPIQQISNSLNTTNFSEGKNTTNISYMNIFKFKSSTIKMPETKIPYLYLIVKGSLRLHTPQGIMDYIPGQYSISAIDTPISGQVLIFSESSEFLALSIEFTPDDVISVVLDIDGDLPERVLNSELSDKVMIQADEKVISSVARLIKLADKPDNLAFMERHLKREIIFNVLIGTCGKQFLQSIVKIQQADNIYKANNWIKQNYKSTFTVKALAEKQNMSISNFHRLMLDENKSVTEAAIEVGYESVSQFTRDYKKMFKVSPKEDIHKLFYQLKTKAHSK